MSNSSISLIRGDDATITVTFADTDLTGATVYFTVKSSLDDADADAVISKDITSHSDPTNGETQIALSSSDTADLAGKYYWDLQLKDSGGVITSTRYGVMNVDKDVTIRTS